MTVIQVPRVLRPHCDLQAELLVPGTTVRRVLDELKTDFPDLYRCLCDETDTIRRHINLFVNNEIVRDRASLNQRLKSNDALSIFQAVSGG